MNSNIVIENNFIKSVGNDIEGDEVECKGKIVIPGLVNSHTHLYSLRLRGTKEFYDFQIIESNEKFLEMGILEMLSFGITTFIDFGSDAKLLKSLSEKYGIRILGGYNEFKNLGDSEFFKEIININLDNINLDNINKSRLLSIHIPLTLKEIYQFKLKNKMMPIEYLYKKNLLSENTQIIHVGWLTNWEIEILKNTKSWVTYVPSYDLKNATGGFPPIKELMTNDIIVTLGTDSVYGNEFNDIWEEAKLALYFYRHLYWDTSLTYRDIFRLITLDSYKALKIKGGLLKEGFIADLVILDRGKLTISKTNDLWRNILNLIRPDDIEITIVSGKISYSKLRDKEKLKKIYEELAITTNF